MHHSLLFFGDIVGSIGRKALIQVLPALKRRFSPSLIIANVENLAHGVGVTLKTLSELRQAGVDAFTGGNHSWGNPLGTPLFDDPVWKTRLIVPTNAGGSKNGTNIMRLPVAGGTVIVCNFLGQLFMEDRTRSAFAGFDDIYQHEDLSAPHAIIIDLHAETTAEKGAFGHFVDGRAAAVLGTHTHVPTADAKILPQGTGYVTDVGRCGAHHSVVGFDPGNAIRRFAGQEKGPYVLPDKGQAEVNGICLQVDLDSHLCVHLDRIREIVDV